MAGQDSTDRARALVSQIIRDARAHDYKALVQIDADPETEELLGLLPERATRQAHAHLKGARAWRVQQSEKAKRKLDAAQAALDALDFSLAKGIVRKIDSSWLDEAGLAHRDEIMLSAEARALELEEIQKRVSASPESNKARRKLFRRR